MAPACRPDSDEECDYPHPPPRFGDVPAMSEGGAMGPIALFGAAFGGITGLCVGLDFYFKLSSPFGMLLCIVLGAGAGVFLAGATVVIGFVLLVCLEFVGKLIARAFGRTFDPDADATEHWRF